ncbi:MAG: hypothetical protein WCJ28_01735 [Actinomycetota bacterium]
MGDVFESVLARAALVEQLRKLVAQPSHAYLLHGPSGSQRESLAWSMAASMLCESGGCNSCNSCQRVLAKVHPDVVMFTHEGASWRIEEEIHDEVLAAAARHPLEAKRKILILPDAELLIEASGIAGGALLKTLEEPTPSTTFILIAEDLAPELATIISRCVLIRVPPVPDPELTDLISRKVSDPDLVAKIVSCSMGSVSRASLLADDAGFRARLELWDSVPERLNGTGSACSALAKELLAAMEESLEPLRARHEEELLQRDDQADRYGARAVQSKKMMTESHKRVERRYRRGELVAGLGILQRRYAKRALEGDLDSVMGLRMARSAAEAVSAISEATGILDLNPNESLLLNALFAKLSGIGPN